MTFVTLSRDYEPPSIGMGKGVFALPGSADPDFPQTLRFQFAYRRWEMTDRSVRLSRNNYSEVEAVHDGEGSGAMGFGGAWGNDVAGGLWALCV